VILVDTHIVVWLAGDPGLISKRAHAAITDARSSESGLGIAAITLWELSMLLSRGRISSAVPLETFLRDVELNFIVYPLNAKIAARSMELGNGYPKDPTDRIIGATALVEGLHLVTRDDKIRASKEVPTIW